MLARLRTIDGVGSAEADRTGELLRLGVSDRVALESVRRALAELGYESSERAGEHSTAGTLWYDAAGARRLSAEEGEIIARRVVPPFARQERFDQSTEARLTAVVAEALYACFAQHTLGASTPPGALREVCSGAVADAARALIDEEEAALLGEAIKADLAAAG